jgi:phosphatidylserine/phosphatidylglycerophosphate/cardiolipin synthase-like enzyme
MSMTDIGTAPGNSNYPVPQNAAWLTAINNAERTIFLQTPNLNAEPLLEPLLNAVRRGVLVTAYVTLGYNDAGELLPGQNGTNEMIAHRLYSSLVSEEENFRLKIHNYVAKDRKSPVHNKFKYRSSHVKLMIVDETVAIQGDFAHIRLLDVADNGIQETAISTHNPSSTQPKSTS